MTKLNVAHTCIIIILFVFVERTHRSRPSFVPGAEAVGAQGQPRKVQGFASLGLYRV